MMRAMASMGTDPIGPVRLVMVGTDRSETATRAVEWAAAFAERFGAELHVVQVVVPEHPADTEHGAAEAQRFARGIECATEQHVDFRFDAAGHFLAPVASRGIAGAASAVIGLERHRPNVSNAPPDVRTAV